MYGSDFTVERGFLTVGLCCRGLLDSRIPSPLRNPQYTNIVPFLVGRPY